MKIRDSRPVTSSSSATAPTGSERPVSTARPADDEIVISGIPEAELTENVRKVLTELLDEVRRLREAVATSHARIAELEAVADNDPLVDALNRRAFVRELDRTLAMRARYDIPSCLVFIDLNDLKTINDTLGHGAGDKALKKVVQIVSENTRQTDIIGRLGGDEFGLILSHIDRATATAKIDELNTMIDETLVVSDDQNFAISVAFGVVELTADMNAEKAITNADAAMYAVKQSKP